jgi:hypothetical protein
LHQELGKVS